MACLWSTMQIYGLYDPAVLQHLDIDLLGVAWFVLLVWTFDVALIRARRRERLRARVLAGDLDAMLPSRIVPDPTGASDVAKEPLVISHAGHGLISATDKGLTFGCPRHRDVMIAWDGPLLLEVWTFGTGKARRCGNTPCGRGAYIEWDMPASGRNLTAEVEDLRRGLLDVIVAHADLTPRTLASWLQVSSARALRTRQVSLSGTVMIAVSMALPFALAVAACVLPLTHEPLPNGYVALSLGMIGCILLGVTTKACIKLLRPAPSAEHTLLPFQVAPPSDSAGSGVYGVRWGKTPSDRLIECARGLLMGANVVPAIWSLNEFQTSPGAGASPHPPQHYLAGLLFTIAIVGSILLVIGFLPSRHMVLADARGLRMQSERRVAACHGMASSVRWRTCGGPALRATRR